MSRKDPENAIQQAIGEAQQLIRQGQGQGALALLEDLAGRYPDSHDLQLNIAVARRSMGDLSDSLLNVIDANPVPCEAGAGPSIR